MSTNQPDTADIERQLHALLRSTNAMMLATVNQEGIPEASYAPYVDYDGCYYIFISGLASHTTNLKQSRITSVMFTSFDENGHPFTRQRLTCHCEATAVERTEVLFESVMQLMEERFGKLMSTLRGLGDFQLFQLKPIKGNFVAGFGQAFAVDFPLGGNIRHKRPD